jgi:hypothetical protein
VRLLPTKLKSWPCPENRRRELQGSFRRIRGLAKFPQRSLGWASTGGDEVRNPSRSAMRSANSRERLERSPARLPKAPQNLVFEILIQFSEKACSTFSRFTAIRLITSANGF